MKASEKTKYRLAKAIKELMITKPLDKISVTDIVKVCEITRPTFYRHFQDKYDLVNWYFEKLATESFEQMGVSLSLREGLQKKFELMKKEDVFFISAFSSQAQNCLIDYDYEYIYQFYKGILKRHGMEQLEDELDFLLRMYCRGSIFMTSEWSQNGMKLSPEKMADYLVDAMPPKLYEILKNL